MAKRADFGPMIDALLDLAQNFSNQGDVKTIIGLLNDLRNEIVDALNTDSAEEAERQDQWQERQRAINAEYYEF